MPVERRRRLTEGRTVGTRERTDPGVWNLVAAVQPRLSREARVLEKVHAPRAPQELRRGRRANDSVSRAAAPRDERILALVLISHSFGSCFHPRHGFSKQSTPAAHLRSFGAGAAGTTACSRADAPRDERIPASGTSPRRPRRWSASSVGSVNVSANFVDFQRQTHARALSRAPNRGRRATEALR